LQAADPLAEPKKSLCRPKPASTGPEDFEVLESRRQIVGAADMTRHAAEPPSAAAWARVDRQQTLYILRCESICKLCRSPAKHLILQIPY
jgi:hypothetical protein